MPVRFDRPVALVGLMGAGKTAVARVLGERLGVSVADLDSMIEAEEGCTVADLFEREGEAYFRRREGQLLGAVLAGGARVIACGGGIVVEPASRELLRTRAYTAWLEVSPQVAAGRLHDDTRSRPLLAGADVATRLRELLGRREAFYRDVCRVSVNTDALPPGGVADAVTKALQDIAA